MKKLILGLMTVFLMTAGLVAFSSTDGAQAANCPNSSYPGCTPTQIDLTKIPYEKYPNNRKYNAQVLAGNTKPTGKITFGLFKGPLKNGQPTGKLVKKVTKPLTPTMQQQQFNTDGQPKGTYSLIVCYDATNGSIWANSCVSRQFTFTHNL